MHLFVWGMTVLLCGCGNSAELSHPPEDDAFVSYYQAVHASASGLVQFKSNAEFEQQREKIDPVIDRISDYRERMRELPPDVRERLAKEEYGDLIKQAQQACAKLEELHAKKPDLFGDRWERYWSALEISESAMPAE